MLHKLNNLEKVKIIARPSKVCKTPYVADIELNDCTIVQAHSASLGCCGLCEKDCYVLASPIEANCKNTKSKVCSYKIYLANLNEENKESLEFSIKGEYEDVKAYAMALKAESDYLRAYIDNGKEAKETQKAKEQADAASKVFVEKTGLPWPFKD